MAHTGTKFDHSYIDAQIERAKATLTAHERALCLARKGSVIRMSKRIAWLLDSLSDDKIMEIAKPLGKRKPSKARKALMGEARGNELLWLLALEREHSFQVIEGAANEPNQSG